MPYASTSLAKHASLTTLINNVPINRVFGVIADADQHDRPELSLHLTEWAFIRNPEMLMFGRWAEKFDYSAKWTEWLR